MRSLIFRQRDQIRQRKTEHARQTVERIQFGFGLIAFEFGNHACGDSALLGKFNDAERMTLAQFAQRAEVTNHFLFHHSAP